MEFHRPEFCPSSVIYLQLGFHCTDCYEDSRKPELMTAEGLMPSENSGAAVMKIALCLHRIPHPVRDPYPDSGSIETEAQRGDITSPG